jgi:hypothetical protein
MGWQWADDAPSSVKAVLENAYNCPYDLPERVVRQRTNSSRDQALIGCEQLAWASVTHQVERTGRKVTVTEWDRACIRIGPARDLTQNPISTTDPSQDNGRSQLGVGQV